MRVLLPPSEGKAAARRGRACHIDSLSLPSLGPMRRDVAAALATASEQPDAAAILGVGAGVAHEIRRNTVLGEAPALRARQTYTGVLFDALDLNSLDTSAKRRAAGWVQWAPSRK